MNAFEMAKTLHAQADIAEQAGEVEEAQRLRAKADQLVEGAKKGSIVEGAKKKNIHHGDEVDIRRHHVIGRRG
jgi:hypothetical protein